MVLYLAAPAPNREVALDILYAPVLAAVATRTGNRVHVHDPLAERSPQLFVATLATQLYPQPDRRVLYLDELVRRNLLQTVRRLALRNSKRRKQELRRTVQLALPVRTRYFETVHRLAHQSYFLHQSVVLLSCTRRRSLTCRFYDHALVVQRKLQN